MKFPRYVKVLISVLFSMLALVLVVLFVDIQLLNPAEYSIQWLLFGVSSALFLANYIFRSARFREFLTGEVSHRSLLGVSLVHGALNYFFPLKMGELSFPLLSRFFLGRTLLESGAALILCRILDLFLVLALFVLVLFVWDGSHRLLVDLGLSDTGIVWVALSIAFGIGVVSIVLFHKRFGLHQRVLAKVSNVSGFGVRMLVRLAIVTSLIWCCILGNFYFLAACLGYQIPLAAMVMVSVVMTPLSLIPVQGFANVGTFELAWVSGLVLFGFSNNESLEIAIKVHILLTIQVIAMLGLGALLLAAGKLGDRYA
ncbi:lysylphosphatidylglycerol synthase transmembrane domain-containing protein [Marinobacter sp. DUT-3]|uniref:lysylphosphatidylglycerol synthase transmembrane domain-containing protein n=1 Tax=Marinobacter sp. DUT-3 TaxID=3412036 RepID=UPI003D1647A3